MIERASADPDGWAAIRLKWLLFLGRYAGAGLGAVHSWDWLLRKRTEEECGSTTLALTDCVHTVGKLDMSPNHPFYDQIGEDAFCIKSRSAGGAFVGETA